MVAQVLSQLAGLAGTAELILGIVERLDASSQAARNEVSRALKLAADIGTVSKATGIGSEQVQRAQYALSRGAGLAAEETNQALLQLSGFLNRARGGDAAATALLRRFGLDTSAQTLSNLPPEAALEKILGGLAAQSSAAQRTADAAQVFGAGPGTKLSAEAETLAASLKTYADEFNKLGILLSGPEILEASRAIKLLANSDFTETLKKAQSYLADETTNESLDIVEGDSPAVLTERRAQLLVDLTDATTLVSKIRHEAGSGRALVTALMLANDRVSDLEHAIERIRERTKELDASLIATQRLNIEREARQRGRSAGDIGGMGEGGMPGGKAPEARAFGGPVAAFAPYWVGERGPELFVPRVPGTVVPNNPFGGVAWPWSGRNPEIEAAKGAIGELEKLLDELDFDWRSTFERMKGVMLDFAETGKFEWRELAEIALDAIQDMLEGWLKLQAQKMGGSGDDTNPWSIILSTAGQALGGLFEGGGSGGETLPAGGVHGPTVGKAAGGPVAAFTPYLVGEEGPELFIPRLPGAIVPNHALGGPMAAEGRTVNQTIVFNVSPGVPEAVRREVAAMIPAITQAAKQGVAADMDRNGVLRRRLN